MKITNFATTMLGGNQGIGQMIHDQIMDRFYHQAIHGEVYRTYLEHIGCAPRDIVAVEDVPMLPICFFKTHEVRNTSAPYEHIFHSSGTTGVDRSAHLITSLSSYQEHAVALFEREVFSVQDRMVAALLPGYAPSSSLVYMLQGLVARSGDERSAFYGDPARWDTLIERIEMARGVERQVVLFGVTHGLLDLGAMGPFDWPHVDIIETGGMKGRGQEIIRSQLRDQLSAAYHPGRILSEYGMTELQSQAYAIDGVRFAMNEALHVLPADPRDPFARVGYGELCRLDVIDMANADSCSFIATEDLGRVYEDGTFEVLGRMDHAVVRGCSLMMV